MLVWKPKILAIGFKSKALCYAFRVVFFNVFCLILGQRYELIIVNYFEGQPPSNWPKLLEKIRAGKIRLLPKQIKIVAITEVPLEITDELTIIYSAPEIWDEKEFESLRILCIAWLAQDILQVLQKPSP